MPRPTKCRKVEFFPDITCFVPKDEKREELEPVVLKVEEMEAMRLKDIENLSQQECADRMGVSRQTFQNIIDSARYKVALALTTGLPIDIRGGNFTSAYCEVKCDSCHKTYIIEYPRDRIKCPNCNSQNIHCDNKSKKCNRWCNR